MRKHKSLKASKSSTNNDEISIDKKGTATFSFRNGDVYNGEYKLNRKKGILVKQGHGVYVTDDFNIYEGKWENDKINESEIHIKYNNGTQYKGRIDAEGPMSGEGTFIFPDGSLLKANWKQNKPIFNMIYTETRGFTWKIFDSSDDEISFFAGNHFWDDMHDLPFNDVIGKSNGLALTPVDDLYN